MQNNYNSFISYLFEHRARCDVWTIRIRRSKPDEGSSKKVLFWQCTSTDTGKIDQPIVSCGVGVFSTLHINTSPLCLAMQQTATTANAGVHIHSIISSIIRDPLYCSHFFRIKNMSNTLPPGRCRRFYSAHNCMQSIFAFHVVWWLKFAQLALRPITINHPLELLPPAYWTPKGPLNSTRRNSDNTSLQNFWSQITEECFQYINYKRLD